MLREADLLGKCNIYATDINETSLEKAKTKKIPVAQMGIGSHNYLAGGGNHNFSQYFTFVNGDVLISEEIGRNMIWSRHNLISDASFNEFNVILCRYVLPNFSNKNWVAHAHKVLFESLTDSGILALGTTESINKTPYELNYTILDEENKIYLKTGY